MAEQPERDQEVYEEDEPAAEEQEAHEQRGRELHEAVERRDREERKNRNPMPDPKADQRSELERWTDFVNSCRSGPAVRLGANMEGLASARHRAALAVTS